MNNNKLRFGHPVIAWYEGQTPHRGKYISEHIHGYWVLLKGNNDLSLFQHAKLDLEGEPINGDMVEVSNNAVSYMPQYYKYIGQRNDGLHTVEQNGIESIFRHVRFPPPSKRDRVEDVLDAFRDSKLWKHEAFVEIDKIYREDE